MKILYSTKRGVVDSGVVMGYVHVPTENKQVPLSTKSPESTPNIWVIVLNDMTRAFDVVRLETIEAKENQDG